jgi:two-component system LytT family response regulator
VHRLREANSNSENVLLALQQALGKNKISNKLSLPTAAGYRFVKVEEIINIEANGSYTCFYLTNDEKLVVSKVMKEFENLLDPAIFLRCHRSYYINLNYVEEFLKEDGGWVRMKNQQQISVSKAKKAELFERLNILM